MIDLAHAAWASQPCHMPTNHSYQVLHKQYVKKRNFGMGLYVKLTLRENPMDFPTVDEFDMLLVLLLMLLCSFDRLGTDRLACAA